MTLSGRKAQKVILYIEDDPGSQILVQRLLQFAGYEVHVAGTGISGIDLANTCGPDLILMDINLPDLSGREVTTRLRAMSKFDGVPIVALTAQSHESDREKALAAGLTGYLTKPIDVDSLPSQVEEYLSGKEDELAPERIAEAHTAYSKEVVEHLEGKIRELETTYNDLKRLDRMKEAFIQLTAHELRTPLTLIYGYGRLLHDSPVIKSMMQESTEVYSLMSMMLDAIDRMSTVINEVLLTSRVASGRIELNVNTVPVKLLLDRVVEEYKNAATLRKMTIAVNAKGAPEKIYGDRDLLALAIGNVLGNAIKYTPDDGTILINAVTNGDKLLLTVRDEGIGIEKDNLKHVFDTFYTIGDTQLHSTSKTAYLGGGLGLGLAITSEILTAHDGEIWAESPGENKQTFPGTTMSITLPIEGRLAKLSQRKQVG